MGVVELLGSSPSFVGRTGGWFMLVASPEALSAEDRIMYRRSGDFN